MKDHYQERLSELNNLLKVKKRQDAAYSFSRLLLVLSILAGIYFAFSLMGELGYLSLALVVVFAVVLKKHLALRKAIELLKNRIAVNEDELAALNDDYSSFDEGREFIDPTHPYSSDIDLFGHRSFFQRVNRTNTAIGRAKLAQRFRANDLNNVKERQSAVKELAAMSEWRESFLAFGKGLSEDAKIKEKLKLWNAQDGKVGLVHYKAFVWSMTLLLPVLSVLLYVVSGKEALALIPWIGVLNLIIFGLFTRRILRERQHVDDLSSSLSGYSQMLALVEDQNFDAELLKHLQDRLKLENEKAGDQMKALSAIIDRLDSLNNLFVAVALNAIGFYHLHAFRDLVLWRQKHGSKIADWIDVLGEFDQWVSLGTYAFNHHDFSWPEVNEKETFKAEEIGHPFLTADERVNNSVKFDGFKLIILTGSNMAGKSTFLRTLGINLVMTGVGLPVCAKALTTPPVQLLSSMKPQDSLDDNQSYFQAEITRLSRLMKMLEGPKLNFILLDEILRGTNSIDKQNGTRAFLSKIKRYNLLGVIATHDVEIANMTEKDSETFSNYFFESKVEGDQLKFDYVLRKGVCNTPNASDLMKSYGIID